MIRQWHDVEPRPFPAWLAVLLLLVGGVCLAVAMVVGGDLRCQRLADTETPCPVVGATAWT